MKIVLIIDDDEVDFMIHGKIITKINPDTIISHQNSVLHALDYLNSKADDEGEWPDFIFLDINIPGMDGFQFLEKYEEFSENLKNKTKIYMLSSSENIKDIERARSNPLVIDYLLKPLNLATATNILHEKLP